MSKEISEIRKTLLQTTLTGSPEEQAAAKDAIAKLDATAKPVPQQKPENNSAKMMMADIEAQIKEHLAEESKYPEPIRVLIAAGQKLFAAASEHVRNENPQMAAGDRDRLIIPALIEFMNNPPEELREYIRLVKMARRYLNAVGIDWPIGGLDWPVAGDKDNPFRDHEAVWYGPQEPEQEKEL